MKIIIGLGNPGQKYSNTRHNIGFAIVDKLKETWAFPDLEFNKKFNAEISAGNYPLRQVEDEASQPQTTNYKLILVKPQGFMNLSGESVRAILDFYKLSAEDIIVIHDDLDIPLGKYRIATDSSSAGHNGVQNIIDALGTQKFKRIRVGIGEDKEGAPICKLEAHDFVLDKFSEAEKEKIAAIEPAILDEIKKLL